MNEAIAAYRQALSIAQQMNNLNIAAASSQNLAIISFMKDDYKQAEVYGKLSLENAIKLNSKEKKLETYQTLAEVFEKQKKYYKALNAYKQYTLLSDSVLNEDKKSEIN